MVIVSRPHNSSLAFCDPMTALSYIAEINYLKHHKIYRIEGTMPLYSNEIDPHWEVEIPALKVLVTTNIIS